MSLQIKKETGVIYDPVFLKILEDIPGGVTIKTDRFPDAITGIKKGTLLNASASSVGLYNVIKTVKTTAAVKAGVTVLAIVPTDHLFIKGEFINLNGGTASTITRVSSTAIAFSATLGTGSIAVGTVLDEALAAAGTGGAVKYDADAILRDTIKVRDDKGNLLDNLFAGAVVRGTVDESELPYFVTDQHKTDLTARIRFA